MCVPRFIATSVGKLERCGAARIELVLLCATLLCLPSSRIPAGLAASEVPLKILVGAARDCELDSAAVVSVEFGAARGLHGVLRPGVSRASGGLAARAVPRGGGASAGGVGAADGARDEVGGAGA